ncbi:LPS assembly lipoprotein LptE [Microvirga guangxiensis]|uniref:LPS-assembly lipoprotein n=1 Tax=Microvirga guangxiensis TaxID=549386 RepID=A0A1G5FX53_9HYPH|nr:LPS assembly lipoprotein LptE [Microvirga guangxiensis]SCY43925.1 LPS-assembly lipoprotein [Microvirga guangxiensis]
MSSFNLKRLAHIAIVASLSLGLTACFKPLYGPTASGESLQTVLAAIDVPEVPWPDSQAVMGHYVRSELIFALNGSGSDTPKRYVLKIALTKSLSTPIVDTETGRASSAIVTGTLAYTLTDLKGTTIITQGSATSSTSYDRYQQRFATVRAQRDAEIRLAKVLVDQVKTRLAATLSAGS